MAKIMFRPRRPSSFARYGLLAIIVITGFLLLGRSSNGIPGGYSWGPMPRPQPGQGSGDESFHPPSAQKPSNGEPNSILNTNKEEQNQEASVAEAKDPGKKRPAQEEDQAAALGKKIAPIQKPVVEKPAEKEATEDWASWKAKNDKFGKKYDHPITKLIEDANADFSKLMNKETVTLEDAAQAYRKRRGRHPPPGFNKWFEFATYHGAVIVEDFWDQIYTDLEPFWGLDPAVIRKESWDFEMTISIRDGVASAGSDWFWTQIWLNMISTIQHLLPDMDLALNAMDEPRIIVPWEDIDEYVQKAAKKRKLLKPDLVTTKFQKLPPPGKGDTDIKTRAKVWEDTNPFWKLIRRGCPPESLARTTPLEKDFDSSPVIDHSNADPHSWMGYISNYTLSSEVCHQPDLQGLEGPFIAPLSTSTTNTLFPMFGGSKLHVNNEILLPAPMYWNDEERFTGGDDHGIPWEQKADVAIWRGVATGGKNRPENWKRFQRHRFVSMNNSTKIRRGLSGEEAPENFALPDPKYNLMAAEADDLPGWVESWQDVQFVDLNCEVPEDEGHCFYTDHAYKIALGLRMSEQFACKFLPDIDGNSFSGRYLGFLRSTSLPIKAAVWKEWHDSRLVAWKHFVPMDSRYGDWFGIMEYFMGYQNQKVHDEEAKKIAYDGKAWAEKVLRKEDMQIYTLRLLLEYARVLDDKREQLGWVDDARAYPHLQDSWSEWW